MERGLVGGGEFVGSHGQAAPLLESVDASFDSVPLLVDLAVEAGRAATVAPPPQAVPDLVGGLRNDSPDAAPT